MTKITKDIIPLWVRADALTNCVLEQFTTMTNAEAFNLYDRLLDKESFCVTATLPELKEEIKYHLIFSKKENPGSCQRIVQKGKKKEYQILLEIPYPILLDISSNKNKKDCFISFIFYMYYALVWQSIGLLSQKHNVVSNTDLESSSNFNNTFIYFTYAGQLCAMLKNDDRFSPFLVAANKGRKNLLNTLKTFKNEAQTNDYIVHNIYNFIESLTEEKYNQLINYCKEQKEIVDELNLS